MFSSAVFPKTDSSLIAFSILIPSWNNLEYLKFCIDSIRKNSLFEHQIIVHVNEGTDRTIEWLKQEQIDYTYTPNNAGICYGMNAAAQLAKSELLCYLNDDMYVLPKWDEHLFAAIEEHGKEDFYLSATLIEPVDTGNKCVVAPNDFGDSPKNFDELNLLEAQIDLEKRDWYGASWPPSIMHKKYWNLIGGFSPEFYPGMYSDPDISMKLWQAGVRHFKGVGKSLVYHFQSKSTSKVKKNNGRLQFFRKWGITSNEFYTNYLKMGEDFGGPLPNQDINPSFGQKLKLALELLKS